jgi:hypothetical protein
VSLNVKRASFVSQTFAVTLQQGVPVEVIMNKPSTVLAVSAFPLNLARSLVSLPTNLLQLKLDYSSKNNELLKAKDTEITNLIRLLETQQRFQHWSATNNVTGKSESGIQTPQGLAP